MCYSFAFFVIGLMLTTTAQALLMWCSRLHDYPFAAPSIWEIIVAVSVYGAVASVIVALLWLVISIQVLDYPIGSYANNTHDAPLVFNIPPQPAAYATYGVCRLLQCQPSSLTDSMDMYSSSLQYSSWQFCSSSYSALRLGIQRFFSVCPLNVNMCLHMS